MLHQHFLLFVAFTIFTINNTTTVRGYYSKSIVQTKTSVSTCQLQQDQHQHLSKPINHQKTPVMLVMIAKEIFITNDHQQSSLCQQNISCSQLSLKNHHCHRYLLLTTIRRLPSRFVSVSFQSKQLTLPAYGISSASSRMLRGRAA